MRNLFISIIFILSAFRYDILYSAENNAKNITSDSLPEIVNTETAQSTDAEKSKNINVDMQVLYGLQYNEVYSKINLSQEGEKIVYLLTSEFNRTGDFGYGGKNYVNSGYYEDRIALTWNWNVLENLKLIIEPDIDNESRGMYNNDIYSREVKDKKKISCKNVLKLSSWETYFIFGGAWYSHRLVGNDPADHERSNLYQGNMEVGGEKIWSASNRIRMSASVLSYDYSREEIENDRHFDAEIIDDFNLYRKFGISIGAGYQLNRDEDYTYPYPRVSLSYKGNIISVTALYRYDMLPFKPEDFYLEQKFILPTYDLPPQKVHHGQLKCDFKMNDTITFKSNLIYESNNNLYNYYTVYGNVISANTLEADSYTAKFDTNIMLYKKLLELIIAYQYAYYDSDKHITYHPNQKGTGSIIYNGNKWKFEWTNDLLGRVYVDPDSKKTIPASVIGFLGVQRIILQGSYFYVRCENIYNNRYNLREGYPEPGFSFLAGLRILI